MSLVEAYSEGGSLGSTQDSDADDSGGKTDDDSSVQDLYFDD